MHDEIRSMRDELADVCERYGGPIRLMEVCGTHTMALFRTGLRSLLPANLKLVSGPGCPVCVTAQRTIDATIELAARPDVIIATYGDMMRVPGRTGSLEQRRAQGAEVRVVYSVRDAVELAGHHPDRTVVFLGVGFETTAPATAAAILEAERRTLSNFCVLCAHKLIVPAMLAILAAGDVPLDGFLCPGHVSVIIGADAYRPIVDRYARACVVAGFEPVQILRGILHLARQIAERQARVENVYPIAVSPQGNRIAQELLERVFRVADAPWRALGVIPASGLQIAPAYERFDAVRRFDIKLGEDHDPEGCRCGEVIQGKLDPPACPLFSTRCTPNHPIGPCMVSSEGTCAAWYKYGRIVSARAQNTDTADQAGNHPT